MRHALQQLFDFGLSATIRIFPPDARCGGKRLVQMHCRIALLGQPEPGEFFQPRWIMQALLFTFVPEMTQDIAETYQFLIDGEAFYFRVNNGKADGMLGTAPDPDLLVVATSEEFLTLGFTDNQAEYALQRDLIKKGDIEALHRFGRAFGVHRGAA